MLTLSHVHTLGRGINSMIFVTVGTEQYPFNALLDWIDILIRYGIIHEEVVIQYGSSTRLPDRVKINKFLPEKEFVDAIEHADVVIAHCGEGTASLLEDMGKPYVLVPRTYDFREHVDDHQIEMADDLEKQGIAIARSPGDLVKFLKLLTTSEDQKLVDETELCEYLSDSYHPEKYQKVMLVCSSGGHFTAMQSLRSFWQQHKDVSWVTFNTPTTALELEQQKVCWAHSPTNRNLPNLVRNLILAFQVLRQEKPDLIISTGAGVAVPFIAIARLLSKLGVLSSHLSTVFVESKTRVKDISLSARILRFFSSLDLLIVRTQELASRYDANYVPVMAGLHALQYGDFKQVKITCFEEIAFISSPVNFGAFEALQFHDDFRELCNDESFLKIVVDMSATRSIDSSGAGTLVNCLTHTVSGGKEFVLWSVSPEVMQVLEMTTLVRNEGLGNSVLVIEQFTQTMRSRMQSAPTIKLHPSISGVYGLFKRLIDIVGAIIGLVITGILSIPIAIAIKLDSPGPLLFHQTRCGLMGRPFQIWKFRSMVTNAEALKSQVQNQVAGNFFKNDQDPRITKVGRFLRKTSLDELPQFWNVLKGEMSLVGTRPPTLAEVSQYQIGTYTSTNDLTELITEWSRLDVKPGITGEWQVKGRSSVRDFKDVVKMDMFYQKNWSLRYDLWLILQTVLVLFDRKNKAV
jgi:anti-anti-sigma factor